MPISQKKILIIDDDPEDLELIREVLEENHFECHTAKCSVEGLKTALIWQPNLILLDLMLPQMSGFGFLRELKKNPELADIPVVVFSTLRDAEIASVSLDIGASGYLSKDCVNQDLLSIVHQYAA